jgi:Holin of 3TMs, for gene-transfer release
MFPLEAVLGLATSLIDRVFPDPAQKSAAQLELLKLQQSGELAQITGQLDINKAEATNPNLFVSGWRPAIGWVCALALAYQYLVRPLSGTVATIAGYILPPLPGLDDNLWQLMMGMLGMGGLRTFEKVQGVASK